MTVHHASEQLHLDEETGRVSYKQGNKIDVDRYEFMLGGNATNVAVGLTRLGIKATLCTEIGDDELSFIIRNGLAREHVDRLFITQTKRSPSNFSVVINFKGDRTIFVQDVEREHDFALEDVSCDYLYLTSMGREWQTPYRKAVDFAKKHEVKLVFNPGSRQLHEGKETLHYVLKHCDTVILNKEEAEIILFSENDKPSSNEHEYMKKLLKYMQDMGPKTVVITNGSHGSVVMNEKGDYQYRGMYPGHVVERTGAGDAFGTGYLAATLYGLSEADAMTWGAINAASVVGAIGAEAGLLTKEAMEEKAIVE